MGCHSGKCSKRIINTKDLGLIMSEIIGIPAKWIVALIVLGLLLFFVFSSLFGVFIGRNTCKVVGSFILRSLKFGGVITGQITELGITTACNLIPF